METATIREDARARLVGFLAGLLLAITCFAACPADALADDEATTPPAADVAGQDPQAAEPDAGADADAAAAQAPLQPAESIVEENGPQPEAAQPQDEATPAEEPSAEAPQQAPEEPDALPPSTGLEGGSSEVVNPSDGGEPSAADATTPAGDPSEADAPSASPEGNEPPAAETPQEETAAPASTPTPEAAPEPAAEPAATTAPAAAPASEPAAEPASDSPAAPEPQVAPAPQGAPASKQATPAKAATSAKPASTRIAQQSAPVRMTTQDSTFAYQHDPRDNPSAMADIVADENAVYGFAPSPTGSLKGYASYDWSDPAIVEAGRQDRIAYHESIEALYDLLEQMQADGATTEEIARAVSTRRNELRLASYEGDPEGLAAVKARNLELYGNENGGTPDFFYEKYGSWETVIEKSFSVNSGMDACLGLYDDYYDVYVASGQVPPDPEDEQDPEGDGDDEGDDEGDEVYPVVGEDEGDDEVYPVDDSYPVEVEDEGDDGDYPVDEGESYTDGGYVEPEYVSADDESREETASPMVGADVVIEDGSWAVIEPSNPVSKSVVMASAASANVSTPDTGAAASSGSALPATGDESPFGPLALLLACSLLAAAAAQRRIVAEDKAA